MNTAFSSAERYATFVVGDAIMKIDENALLTPPEIGELIISALHEAGFKVVPLVESTDAL